MSSASRAAAATQQVGADAITLNSPSNSGLQTPPPDQVIYVYATPLNFQVGQVWYTWYPLTTITPAAGP